MSNKKVLNYYCTWAKQVASADGTTTGGRDYLDHQRLFGENGLCRTLYPTVRGSLLFMLDDGWELPYSDGNTNVYHAAAHEERFGSQRISEDKFPNYGETPKERLKTMVQNIKACGWAGAGIWICASEERSVSQTLPEGVWNEEYWIERINWSRYAGISYWKIDWGRFHYDQKWRRFISDTAAKLYPELIIEHTLPEHPLNDIFKSGRLPGEKLRENLECLSYSDVYRTYDVTEALTAATTFDRMGEMLCGALPQSNNSLGILNCEDELYMGAALGASIGIMRYPNMSGARSCDEVVRAVKFQQLAPPFPAYASSNKISEEWLEDEWFFRDGETWKPEAFGHIVMQCAPACIARNTELPIVKADGEKPFVSVCKNPNGVFSVATYPRTTPIKSGIFYPADIIVFADTSDIMGIFGEYKSLTIKTQKQLNGIKIMVADMLTDEFTDMTDRVKIGNGEIVIPGELIKSCGLSAATAGDTGAPAMLLRLVE